MQSSRDVELLHTELDERVDARIEWEVLENRRCRVTLSFGDVVVTGEDLDLFEAFCDVRNQLEHYHLRPICYGASINVWPSGMCRDMGDGINAYRMTPGEPASLEQLVHIFHDGPDVEPASVEEQERWWRRWRGGE